MFTHIPKSGGTSFRSYINDAGKQSGVSISQRYIPGFNLLPAKRNYNNLVNWHKWFLSKRRIRLCALHAPYGVHTVYSAASKNPFYYTILRNPIDRVLSHYFYFIFTLGKLGLKDQHINDLDDEKLSFIIAKLSNLSVYFVSGKGMDGGTVNKEDLILAQTNLLENYGAYGLLDRMGESLELLSKRGPSWLTFPSTFPREKVMKKTIGERDVSKRVLDAIMEANQYEIEFYEFAKMNFG